MRTHERFARWAYIGGLMLAGESIYMLPYMRKTFQTSMEEVFQISSTELGLLNAGFGILALICYFPSGWLADNFSARKLLILSLVSTGCGGMTLLLEPAFGGLLAIHAAWGITSILTFWGALIKATREWGQPQSQGTTFGLLDAGRGITAALLASLATAVFAYAGTTAGGLHGVIWVYSLAPLVAAIVVWYAVPDAPHANTAREPAPGFKGWEHVKRAAALPQVWLLAAVVFTAYTLYLGTYAFPAYAEQAHGQSKTVGAVIGTGRDWMRPLAALAGGLLADRFRTTRTIGAAYLILLATFTSLWLLDPETAGTWLLWLQVILAGLAVFAIRGIYFALLQEAGIPHRYTGTAVGIVSLVGFMPDAFAHLLFGWFIDTFEGALGYRYHFGLLALVSLAGILAVLAIELTRHPKPRHPQAA